MSDFGTLKIDQVILHRVPSGARKADAAETIEFSEAPIELSAVDQGFIEIRLKETLAGRARFVIEDVDTDSGTPNIVRGLLGGGGDLVADSAALAIGLHQRQKWVSPIGLLMVITGVLEAESCLVIAKMEHEEGMRVQRTETEDGKRTYKAEYLKDLILGEGTKIFKVGVFRESGAQPGVKLTGEVVDAQHAGSAVAAYFVEFLGCIFTQQADVLTETFYKETQRFVAKAAKGDPEKSAEYEMALLSEMNSGARQLVPETFAQVHLRPEDRDAFVSQMQSCGLPVKGFKKNVELIRSTIRRLKVQTSRGATVLVPPDMYEDGTVTVKKGDGDLSTVTLTDRITGMTGTGGPKVPL